MPAITYVEEFEPDVQARVRARFDRDMKALATLGFRELCFYREQFGLFSGILNLPTFLLMLSVREVMSLHKGLQAGASFILMYHQHPTTLALPFRMGVKLYTGFADRTLLISTNFGSCALPRPGSGVVKNSSRRTLTDAWDFHRQRIGDLVTEGKQVHRSVGFNDYVELSRQEEVALA